MGHLAKSETLKLAEKELERLAIVRDRIKHANGGEHPLTLDAQEKVTEANRKVIQACKNR